MHQFFRPDQTHPEFVIIQLHTSFIATYSYRHRIVCVIQIRIKRDASGWLSRCCGGAAVAPSRFFNLISQLFFMYFIWHFSSSYRLRGHLLVSWYQLIVSFLPVAVVVVVVVVVLGCRVGVGWRRWATWARFFSCVISPSGSSEGIFNHFWPVTSAIFLDYRRHSLIHRCLLGSATRGQMVWLGSATWLKDSTRLGSATSS